MRRTYAYFISLLLVLMISPGKVRAQDTIIVPLKIKVGLEITGPLYYIYDKNILNAEASVSVDLDEKKLVFFSAGYLDYQYSQYNYNFSSNGVFVKGGLDFNFLKPDKAMGKYWTGIGIRYGLSRFNAMTSYYSHENYWNLTTSSIPKNAYWGHFLEINPEVRAEIFKNFSMGWSISLKKLIYVSTGKDLRPINFPGYGNGTKSFTAGVNYYIVWNIPYKKINVIIKPNPPEEPDETQDAGKSTEGRQSTGIRQQ